jgi:tetratricopeptide (TPR) repeat protein
MSSPAISPGTRLGPYEIRAPLGAGGMGEVYRARDPRLERDVAIKVLPADVAADPARLRRFEQEARAVAALSHPNVLAIFDVSSGTPPFLVTELLEGGTLRARLRRYDEALASATKATKLDSFAPFIHSCACVVAYLAGRHEEAVRHGDRSLELHPDFAMALYLTGFALCQLGRFDRAVERFERLAAVGGRHPIFIGLLGYAYGAAGRRSDAMALADELERRRATEYVIPSAFLLVWAGLDERDRLHAALVECLAEGVNGPAVTLWLSPYLPALNKEPRFAEAFSQLGLRIS